MSAQVHVGTSGWSYNHWQGVFYPDGLPAARRLAHFVTQFSTTEVNNSYYRWPSDAVFASWERQLPPGFLMSVKAPRGLTHYTRLLRPEAWIARITGGLARLRGHLGVLLVQLPVSFARDDKRLDWFLGAVPSWVRVAMELRHPSWQAEEVYAILEHRHAAYCVMSGAGLPCVLRATAPFVYVRLHGPDPSALYGGSYTDDNLHWWADRIREWLAQDREVYAYFNNDGNANAVHNARTLKRFLGL